MALDQQVDRLERALERLAEAMADLAAQMSRLTGEVGGLKGRVLEADYREKAYSYFARILLGVRSVPRDELGALAADAGVPVVAAVAGERITPEADQEANTADVWRVLDGRAFRPGSPVTPGPDL